MSDPNTDLRCCFQADSTHNRVVKREEGEKLAKVSDTRDIFCYFFWLKLEDSKGDNDDSVLNVIFLRYDVVKCLSVQEFGVPFMETSAKSGLNVELAFTAVAKWVPQLPEPDRSYSFRVGFFVRCCFFGFFWSTAGTFSSVPCWLSYLRGDISVVLPFFCVCINDMSGLFEVFQGSFETLVLWLAAMFKN